MIFFPRNAACGSHGESPGPLDARRRPCYTEQSRKKSMIFQKGTGPGGGGGGRTCGPKRPRTCSPTRGPGGTAGPTRGWSTRPVWAAWRRRGSCWRPWGIRRRTLWRSGAGSSPGRESQSVSQPQGLVGLPKIPAAAVPVQIGLLQQVAGLGNYLELEILLRDGMDRDAAISWPEGT